MKVHQAGQKLTGYRYVPRRAPHLFKMRLPAGLHEFLEANINMDLQARLCIIPVKIQPIGW